MSLIKANAVQIGQSPTATQNFTLAVPSSPDGTIKLARGNSGVTTQDVMNVSNAGVVSFPQGLGNISNSTAIATGSTTARSLANRFADVANVLDFGADPTGATDSTTAIQNAIATGKNVYIPKGDYKCNVVISNRTVIYGDGSTATRITPYNNSSAAMLYTFAAMTSPGGTSYWNYHSKISDIGFYGSSALSGGSIGFSFGTNSPTVYTTNAEFANNVQFYNCFFKDNYIGVQFPLGNIGSAFYSCGFTSNYYGIYTVDNKTGSGGLMHAGNKYFYNGEFNSNTCAIYCDNTTDGFGGFEFTDVIFEYNNIVTWIRDTKSNFIPVVFRNCWNELNGSLNSYTTATIDSWSGSVRSTQVVSSNYPWIISNNKTIFDGCFVTGINLKSAESSIEVKNSRIEQSSGVIGQLSLVDDNSSSIYVSDCYTYSGFNSDFNIISKSYTEPIVKSVTNTNTVASRGFWIPKSYSKIANTNKTGVFLSLASSAVGYGGSSSGASLLVTDGIRYTNCNEFTYNFSSSSLYIVPNGAGYSVPSAGWYAVTVDVKFTSGSPCNISLQNLSTHQMFTIKPKSSDSQWRTIGGYGYYPSAASAGLWFGGVNTGSCTFRVSAFQLIQMNSEKDCLDFIDRNTFLE